MDVKIGILVAIFIFLISISIFAVSQPAFAETESFTVAARSYEQVPIYLNQGDGLNFSISVSGGTNDDIDLIIFYPNGDEPGGFVYEEYDSSIVAPSSGTYVFSFDNRFSLISNKFVQFSYERIQNTFYVYVEELPEWADYASNVVYEGIEFWKSANPQLNFYVAPSEQNADLRIQWVKEFGVEHVGFALGNVFIEVGLGDSNCRGTWHPYSSDHVAYIMKHEIGHVLKLEHVNDPKSIMNPIVQNVEWGLVEEEFTLTEGYGQFVSLCTTKDLTAFGFNVETNDPTFGFDVYLVPSIDSFYDWSDSNPFRYYSDENCFGEGFLAYSGSCQGVRKGAGLLVIMDKQLSNPLTKITIKTQEMPLTTSRQQTTSLLSPPKPILDILPTLSEKLPQQTQIQPKSETTCGPGTIFKDGVCVLEPTTQSNGGGCLIATATYGSELAPQVQMLREIRDNSLLQTQSGQSFMQGFNSFYYSFSPTIADYERQNPVFKEAVKLTITPLLASLSLLNYVNLDSEESVLGYGIGIILMNIGMYFVAPALLVVRIYRK